MFKIIAISCVLVGVVISFHKVKGIQDVVYNPGDISLPQNIQILESVINSPITSNDIEKLNHVKAAIETSIIGYIGKIFDAIVACKTVYDDGRDAISQTKSILNSCSKSTTNETYIINSKIQTLTDSANSVKKTMAKNMQAIITECSQQPLNITSCLDTINRNIAEINVKNLADVAMVNILQKVSLLSFSNIIRCFTKFLLHFTPKYFEGIINDTKYCFQDVRKLF